MAYGGLQWLKRDLPLGSVTYAEIQDVAANKVLGRTTGTGTVEEITCTAFARSILDDADAATVRATIGAGTGSGSGDVTGPSSATDSHVVVFNGTSGKAIKSSGVALSAYQPVDAELTAISGLVSATDTAPYFTGSGTAALATLTAAGRALIDDADAAAQRTTLGLGTIATQSASSVSISGGSVTGITDLAVADGGTGASDAATARTNLGLVIGTNVQAYDAELAALAGLVSAANKVPRFTGSGTAEVIDVTYGTYTMTLTNTTNVASSSFARAAYIRVGTSVFVTFAVNVTPTAGSATTVLDMTLPVASNTTNAGDIAGAASALVSTTYVGGRVAAETTGDTARLTFTSANTNLHTFFGTFGYNIL